MTWRLLSYRQNSAFENMAIDEAVFEETVRTGKSPTLRLYGWRPAAVSIGYFQDVAAGINLDRCRAEGVDVIRRPTGGKAVFHSAEVTYSLVASRHERLFPDDIQETYRIISLCLVRALSSLGIEAVLSPPSPSAGRRLLDACCFSAPSGNELLVKGRKICGSAQMRTRGGFLQHGSILMSFDPDQTADLILPGHSAGDIETLAGSVAVIHEELGRPVTEETVCEALERGFTEELNIRFSPEDLTATEAVLSAKLISKYRDLSWRRTRTRAVTAPG
ncbi:MAG TPA: lipoate--protein ligase family protein [Smithellaceae bacterium]|nr:lipoate--protein ligase family protein [Smithellaceae bacterium]